MSYIKFLNDILKPWMDFNVLLAQPYAVQPELSEFTRVVDTLAISLSHWGEMQSETGRSIRRKQTDSFFNNIADTAKHTRLRDSSRVTKTTISSCFLCNEDDEFQFIRNVPYISYPENPNDCQEYDFMIKSLEEIRAIIAHEKMELNLDINIAESIGQDYKEEARLKFETRYCVKMESTRIRFFKKKNDVLEPYDPPEVKFAVY